MSAKTLGRYLLEHVTVSLLQQQGYKMGIALLLSCSKTIKMCARAGSGTCQCSGNPASCFRSFRCIAGDNLDQTTAFRTAKPED